MSERPVQPAARAILRIAEVQAKALGRIARAYADLETGRCTKDRVLEVVRQEIHRADRLAHREARAVRLPLR